MNKEDIEFYREEINKYMVETNYGPGLPAPYAMLQSTVNEIERLQAVIWICDQVLTDGFDSGERTEELPEYDIQAVNWVHRQLSQALKESK